ncbi:MAG: hypothetical protein KAX55_04030 [Propionivibrio sp.]|nr:hypothetical protein [Propionivibrio sp.]
MTKDQPKTNVRRGFDLLREGYGRTQFLKQAAMVTSVAFLAITGCVAIVLGVAVHNYGIDRAFGEVTGVQAITMLRGVMLNQIPLMLFTSVLFGVLSGLNNAGVRGAHAESTR